MSDAPTQQLPEHHRHSEEPPTGNPVRPWLIVVAIVLGLAVIAVVVLLVVRSSGAPGPTPTPTQSSASPTPSPSPTPTPTPTQTTAPAVTSCKAADLTVTLGQPDGTAGATYLPVIFANSGAQPCTLTGFPIVYFVDSSGTKIGAAGAPDTSQPQNENTVQPGNSVASVVKITSAGNLDNCDPQDAAGLTVQAPNVSQSVTLDASGYTACGNGNTNILSVGPIATG